MEAKPLIVVLNTKNYIKAKSQIRVSNEALDALDAMVRNIVDQAVLAAHLDDRRTLMARDFKDVVNQS